MQKEFELFVPGRLCLFGEHSDWAGGHRRQNSELEKGYAIVAPTNQGTYAKVTPLSEPVFRFKSSLFDDFLEVGLDSLRDLERIAEQGKDFSYMAGVAHEVLSSYHKCSKSGLEVDCYKTDLPVQAGLSSSASVCVLTAKAFNEAYELGLTTRRIMELAYLGEITTPSRCGKLDQACAYPSPVLITFDADKIKVEELKIKQDVPFLIVDLKKDKDTVKILSDLNKGFPWANTDEEATVQKYLGPINKEILVSAKERLWIGDVEGLGGLMTYAQRLFDSHLQPVCSELEAPVLHSVLEMLEIQDFVYGGKGVGSGGDGTAQFVCKSEENRENAKRILESKGFGCLELDIKSTEA